MHILDSHEFIELYRGDKDLRIGKILALDYDCTYTVMVPDLQSPADRKILDEKSKIFSEFMKGFPEKMNFIHYKTHLIYFNRKNISLGGFFQVSLTYFMKLFKAKRVDLILENVYTTFTPRMYMTFFYSILTKTPVIYVDAGDIPAKGTMKKFLSKFEKICIENSKGIIVYNELGSKRYLLEYGISSDRISVIPKPVDSIEFNPMVSGADFKTRFSLEDKFVVGYFGRLDANKGSACLLKVAKELSERNLDNIIFLFVGGNIENKSSTNFKQILLDYDLPNVVVTGMISHDEMPMAYASTDIVVFPDITNIPGFPTVLAEAMSMQKPIVAGINGYEEASPLNPEMGLIIPPRDIGKIIESILLLKDNPHIREKFGLNCRKFVELNMDYDKVVHKYYALFLKAVAK
ncbi:glycosyltransferase involved in cell wall biosynthesis [Methanolinea mesophila]|uniref:glycosyltransferase n=1 Tax=Methanolinea mesophila TaxID=547055 RepID=UPI001AE77550|nr:glycosyltransferase [Methanolinea mesophila]MBP1928355.1 glycosyltransferase involved in cell wall biosynthesis [Methanolinea mesophila]